MTCLLPVALALLTVLSGPAARSAPPRAAVHAADDATPATLPTLAGTPSAGALQAGDGGLRVTKTLDARLEGTLTVAVTAASAVTITRVADYYEVRYPTAEKPPACGLQPGSEPGWWGLSWGPWGPSGAPAGCTSARGPPCS